MDRGATVTSLIHPDAVIGSFVEIGIGSIVVAGAVVNTGAKLDECVILNTCASVDHVSYENQSLCTAAFHAALLLHDSGSVPRFCMCNRRFSAFIVITSSKLRSSAV